MNAPGITRRYAATPQLRIAAPGAPGWGRTCSPAPVQEMPGGRRPGGRSGQVHQPEPAQEAEFVQAPPALHDAAVTEAPDIDPGKGDGTARRRHAENLALLRAASGEVLDHQVALADQDVHLAVPVGEGGAEHGSGRPHALPVGRDADRRVMVDELLGQVLVDGAEVTPGEQGIDELGNGVLVLLNCVHDHSLRRAEGWEYPSNLGFFTLHRHPNG